MALADSHPSTQARWRIVLSNKQGELDRLASFIHDFAKAVSLDRERTHALDLALTECVTNVIAYGFDSPDVGTVVVRLWTDESSVRAEVEDDGKPFNPLNNPVVDTSLPLEQKPIGGLGIHLMRTFLDEITYERREGKNRLRLKKLWPRSS